MSLDEEKAKRLRDDFPIFTHSGMTDFTYLDNGATSQKPMQVIRAISEYYERHNSNIHRGIYDLSERSGKMYHDSKVKVSRFLNAETEEIIYTRNTTESLNLVANSLLELLSEEDADNTKDEIVLTEMEHHSNLVPWQQIAKRRGFRLRFIPVNDDLALDMDAAAKLINKKTAIVAFTHVSNSLGTVNPVAELISLAQKNDAYTVVDAAQSAPHMPLDVKCMDCDFLAFSAHKMLGPMGIGVLYGKRHLLEWMTPFLYGGDMIRDVSKEETSWNVLPMKFEAGTPNVAGAVGLMAAIDYLESIGMKDIESWGSTLADYTEKKLREMEKVKVYRTLSGSRSSIVSFTVDGLHHHDMAQYLSDRGVCIRVGHHCTMPLMKTLGIEGTARASFYIYNTKEDVDHFIRALKASMELFGS
ncbi:MAG: aminotransferase class V-fold PLP-dependent enzyme [Candidatus Woesearchaeota archaeon]